MKKLNVILCACAIAIVGLSVSCKNEPEERKNVGYKNYQNSYTISGTVTVAINDKVCDADGTVGSNDTETTTISVEKGLSNIYWTTSKTYSTNGIEYAIYFNSVQGKYSSESVDKDGNKTPGAEKENISNLPPYISMPSRITLCKIGKKYYLAEDMTGDDDYLPVSDGFECADLDSGNDFTLSFSYVEKENNLANPIAVDSKAENTTTTTTTYNIKFTAK